MTTSLTEEEITRLGHLLVFDLPDAIVQADTDGVIRHWNDGARRVFGFSAEEALGQSLDIIIPERLRARHWAGFREVMETGRSRYGAGELLSVPALTKSGEQISIQFSIALVHSASADIVGIVAVLRDVTATFQELKRLRAELG